MKQEKKNVEEMNVIELKAQLFDIDNEVKRLQQMYQQVGQVLQNKVKEGNKSKEENKDDKKL